MHLPILMQRIKAKSIYRPLSVLLLVLGLRLLSLGAVSAFSIPSKQYGSRCRHFFPAAVKTTRLKISPHKVFVLANRGEDIRLTETGGKAPDDEYVPKTISEALRVFFLSSHSLGPTTIAITLSLLIPWRLTVAPITLFDGVAFLGSITFWLWQEHVLHAKLLHSESDWYGKAMHQGHHDRSYFHISIDPAPLMLIWLGAAHLIFRSLMPLPIACSATLGYAIAGLTYEWLHYIVHTKVRPKSEFMKKVRDHHIRHHCVDQRFWFAFSAPMVDTIFGTNPNIRTVQAQQRRRVTNSDR